MIGRIYLVNSVNPEILSNITSSMGGTINVGTLAGIHGRSNQL